MAGHRGAEAVVNTNIIPPVVLVEGEAPCDHVGPRRWIRTREPSEFDERLWRAVTTVLCDRCGAVMDVTVRAEGRP